VLSRLETLVRQYPEHWFNFIPLNPVAQRENTQVPATAASVAGPI
jgi:hypothetical protein